LDLFLQKNLLLLVAGNLFSVDLWFQSRPSIRTSVRTSVRPSVWMSKSQRPFDRFFKNFTHGFLRPNARTSHGRFFDFRKNLTSGGKKRPFLAYFLGFLDLESFFSGNFYLFFDMLFSSLLRNFNLFTPKSSRKRFLRNSRFKKYVLH